MTMFRFTIRDLLWLTAIAALAAAWLADRSNLRGTVARRGELIHNMAQEWANETSHPVKVSYDSWEVVIGPKP
jgi:hypothetical protein